MPNDDDLPERIADRYRRLEELGRGGMGSVWRVEDERLGRRIALKVVRSPADLRRFEEETRVAASLQHPGIVPVHDAGVLPDGRLWFTMHEVEGASLDQRLREVHAAWRLGREHGSLRRLLEAFLRVCETVAYAHARGVVHRDLKPQNVMLGAFGEVFVLDWGLAKAAGRDRPTDERRSPTDDPALTRADAITGTPAYMSPEQARGCSAEVTPRSDVYSLGATLYDVLCERPPRVARNADLLLDAIARGAPITPPSQRVGDGPPIDEALDRICLCALATEPGDRYPDATALAADLAAWLDGARSRERAAAMIAEADALVASSAAAREEAGRHSAEADRLLGALPPHAVAGDKRDAWAAEDRSREAAAVARTSRTRAVQLLRAALSHDPEARAAHDRLADLFQEVHRALEDAGHDEEAEAIQADLAVHDVGGRHAAYLRGTGALTVHTDLEVEVRLHRYVERDRQLVPEPVRSLGRTPLDRVPLDRGSWLLTLHREGHDVVRYPVSISRGEHWHGVRPGDREPWPVHVPAAGEIGPDEVYVPAGWCWTGEDEFEHTLPVRRMWCDAFAIGRCPVTVGEYVRWLDELHAVDPERALAAQPLLGDADEPLLARDEQGRFTGIRTDRGGAGWDLLPTTPDTPLVGLDWFQARAYAEAIGRRLPMEREWQKAARGADRRRYPWGDHLEPSWCRMSLSAPRAMIVPVTDYPADCSPYGVRGLAGNVLDWVADGPPDPAEQLGTDIVLVGITPAEQRFVVGGSCGSGPRTCETTQRARISPHSRAIRIGVRLCRTIG